MKNQNTQKKNEKHVKNERKKNSRKTRLDIHINRNTNAASKRRTRRDVGFFSVVVVPLLLIDAASVFLDEPRK